MTDDQVEHVGESAPWEHLSDEEWPDRVGEAMHDLVAALIDSNAGLVNAKAIGHDDRCIESFSVVLLDDQYVGAWVDCATGNALFGVLKVAPSGRTVPPDEGSSDAST